MLFRLVLFAFALALGVASCQAGETVDRIRKDGVIRCGGVPRPGLVGVSPDGRAQGLYLDLCRALGAAVLGPDGRMEFHQYDSDKNFDAARKGVDDVMFVTASEIAEHSLYGLAARGPTVFFESTAVMVPGNSPFRALSDLAGAHVCYWMGYSAERHLNAWLAAHKLDVIRGAYSEDVELADAYNVQVCKAMAAEATDLAALRLSPAGKSLSSRILEEPLAVFPVIAATPTRDAQWSALVGWAIDTLIVGEKMPIKAPELGLSDDWQKRVLGAAGSYADIYRRNLGEGSRLKLPPGPNAPREEGGLFVEPFLE